VKLGEIESQLQRAGMGSMTAERYSYLATAVVDVSTPAIHSAQTLIAKVGGANAPIAQGIQSTVTTTNTTTTTTTTRCTTATQCLKKQATFNF